MVLSEIWVYPIKSLGGISLQHSAVLESGLEMDRRWMLIDKNDKFITQRQHAHMAQLGVKIEDSGLKVFEKTNISNEVFIPFEYAFESSTVSSIWKASVDSYIYGNEINSWFSDFLKIDARLVTMDKEKMRHRSLTVKPYETDLSFADGYPFLVVSKASVEQLNSEISEEVDLRQFRANLIIDDCAAFAEDDLKKFTVGDVQFNMVKPCVRCPVITINQDTGEKSKEPLLHLSKTRNIGNQVIFAMNAALLKGGHINVGDKVEKITK